MAPPSGGTRISLSASAAYLSGKFGGGGPFSPGAPPTPAAQEPVRAIDFPVGFNRQFTPRAPEPVTFGQLRAFSNIELVRFAIETRKDQIERLRWKVRSRDEKKPKRGADNRIEAATTLLRRPDGRRPFAAWMRILIEDLLVLDAPAIERRRNLAGELVALDVVAGDTIKVLVDDTGRRPAPPLPAYQQVIKGRVWADLTTDDLIYAPRNERSNHVYGYGPVEQIIVTIRTIFERQARQLAWFTEGNSPPGFLSAPDGWTPDNIKAFQAWLNATLAGNAEERAKIIVAPFGTGFSPIKDPPLKDEFDEWLARVVCYCFNLPPTPFIKQMNRSTSEADADRALEEGREPLMLWAKRILDDIIQVDLGFEDLEFDWDVPRDIDPKVQAEIDNMNLRNASKTIDEVRDARGEQPLPNGLGSKPLIYTAKGATLLEHVITAKPEGEGEGDADPKAETDEKDPEEPDDA